MSGLTTPTGDTTSTSILFFSENAQRKLLAQIIEYALEAVHVDDFEGVSVDFGRFFSAMREANFDIEFVHRRRGLENGISEGKLAGIVFYRLTRERIINLNQSLLKQGHFQFLQEEVMIKIIGALLHVDFSDEWIAQKIGTERSEGMRQKFQDLYNELRYISCRRHYNQESLALFFDSMVYLQTAIDEMRRISSALKDELPD
ncbi:hypothetical protein V5T82_10445 [Magnetovibrio sp. PR-2]|uniref:hypothetical protein n=1 Tax=Magnetovibrio sp. PR-2 TaxID=3120356 RepID=UPI002FCDFAEF